MVRKIGFSPKMTESYMRATKERQAALENFNVGDRVRIVGGDEGVVRKIDLTKRVLFVQLNSGKKMKINPVGVEILV